MIRIPKIRSNVLIADQATGQVINFIYGTGVFLHVSPADEIGYEGCYMLKIANGGMVMAEMGPFTDVETAVFEDDDSACVISLTLDFEADEDDDLCVDIQDDEAGI